MKLVSRKDWGARAPKASPVYLSSTRGVKVHYTGEYEDPAILNNHGRCAGRLRAIQNDHMDSNGWNDIAYNFLVCDHGYVFEGRGLHHLSAANGPGLNTGHYAVCGLVGNKGTTQPPRDMLIGIRDAIDYLCSRGNAGQEIKGHRDGYSTDCPGDPLYAWVKKGAPRPSAPPVEDDDLPGGRLNEGPQAVTPIALPKGRYKTVGFVCDNALQGKPPALLRVATGTGAGTWQSEQVTVDSTQGQTVVTFPDAGNTVGLSVRREDDGDVAVAWEVS
ncbi:MAG: hypothetical protein QOE54_310 [Streptosporangiaceae bacterium]|jgi:hypothetical protein|nr:hypothetical protein [Streptosporangiaceae bacterium]